MCPYICYAYEYVWIRPISGKLTICKLMENVRVRSCAQWVLLNMTTNIVNANFTVVSRTVKCMLESFLPDDTLICNQSRENQYDTEN